jgi:hypothetical protein
VGTEWYLSLHPSCLAPLLNLFRYFRDYRSLNLDRPRLLGNHILGKPYGATENSSHPEPTYAQTALQTGPKSPQYL